MLRAGYPKLQHAALSDQRRLERLERLLGLLRRWYPDPNLHQPAAGQRRGELFWRQHSDLQHPALSGQRRLVRLERLLGVLRRRHPDPDV